MRIDTFALERMQSTYENEVDFNLSESGVHPLTLGELADDTASREALLAEALRYTQSNGTAPLRGARRPRGADDVGTARPRDRDERPVEGVRIAGAAHRVDRRAAAARRGALVVSRLHDDCAGRAERRARAARARAGAPIAHPR